MDIPTLAVKIVLLVTVPFLAWMTLRDLFGARAVPDSRRTPAGAQLSSSAVPADSPCPNFGDHVPVTKDGKTYCEQCLENLERVA